MRNSYHFEAIVTALSSISHLSETSGIYALFRRVKYVLPNGRIEEIPEISGNSVRGTLRDCGMLHFCRLLGYGVDEESGTVHGLPLNAFYFLFSGGSLVKASMERKKAALDISAARQLREYIPLVSVFGGAVGNQILPGRLLIGKMLPIAAETAHLIPPSLVGDGPLPSVWDLLQVESFTRKDDEKDDRLRYLLEAGDAENAEQIQAALFDLPPETALAVREIPAQQMRYHVETLAAGTRFYWWFALQDASELEFQAFVAALYEWGRAPHIGGRKATGHGRIRVDFVGWRSINPLEMVPSSNLPLPEPRDYVDFVVQRRDEIRGLLHAI